MNIGEDYQLDNQVQARRDRKLLIDTDAKAQRRKDIKYKEIDDTAGR